MWHSSVVTFPLRTQRTPDLFPPKAAGNLFLRILQHQRRMPYIANYNINNSYSSYCYNINNRCHFQWREEPVTATAVKEGIYKA